MDIYSKIKDIIQELCQSGVIPSAFVLAKVKKVDGQTCSVLIGDLELADVRLRAVVNQEESGILITPKEGSFVMITDLSNGRMSDWAVAMYSEVDKVEFNGGKNGGMINIQDLVDHINTIEDDINRLKTAMIGWVPSPQDGGAALKGAITDWSAQQITKTQTSDIEDDKITH